MNSRFIVLLLVIIASLLVNTSKQSEFDEIFQLNDELDLSETSFDKDLRQTQLVESTIKIVRVIFHIIHKGEPIGNGSNVADERIMSQLQVLNNDYGRVPNTLGYGIGGVDTRIQFELAGIYRVNYTKVSPPYTIPDVQKYIQPDTIISPNLYLNIWCLVLRDVSKFGVSIMPEQGCANISLAENTFKGDIANVDGVYVNTNYFGVNSDPSCTLEVEDGYGDPPALYEHCHGRTATHEVGHFLGLVHVFGDVGGTCQTDYCEDTPWQTEAHTGPCNVSTNNLSCKGSIPIFTNYMDYSDDVCLNHFTLCQTYRMQQVLVSCPRRSSIWYTLASPNSSFVDLQSSTLSICPDTELLLTIQNLDPNMNSLIINTTIGLFLNGTQIDEMYYSGLSIKYNEVMIIAGLESTFFNSTHFTKGKYRLEVAIINLNGMAPSRNEFSGLYLYVIDPTDHTSRINQTFDEAVFPPIGWEADNRSHLSWESFSNIIQRDASRGSVAGVENFNRSVESLAVLDFRGNLYISTSENLQLSFNIAYSPLSNTAVGNDSLTVNIRFPCSNTSIMIYKKIGSDLATVESNGQSFQPESSREWRTELVDISLPAILGQHVWLSFEFYAGAKGNNLYLDDVNVKSISTPSEESSGSSRKSWFSVVSDM